MSTTDTIDLVFSFDTTGSMYPCLTQVRRYVEDTVKYLFEQIPNIRIGVLTHGDYCDGDKVITSLDLTNNKKEICKFIRKAPQTGGGDADECYELVLNEARQFTWTSGTNKAFILIGDANPHPVGYKFNGKVNQLDWKNELGLLKEAGVHVYPIQALGRSGSNRFYNEIAQLAGTMKLDLNQFSDINDIICAICMQRADKLQQFEEVLHARRRRPSHMILKTVNQLKGVDISEYEDKAVEELEAVHPSRFQVLYVDRDISIKDFVEENGLSFNKGRGFYQFIKTVKVQSYKEVIIEDLKTGKMFHGNKAREILGIPVGVDASVKPTDFQGKYRGFIQSTSYNRKLLAKTYFLYEIEDFTDE